MKATIIITLLVILHSITCYSQLQSKVTDEKLYGQKPPGTVPELYQPEFSFLNGVEYNDIAISSDGKEFCYTTRDTSTKQNFIYYLKKKKRNWTKPELAYFIPNKGLGSIPQFSPDGKRFSYSYKGDFWSSIKKSNKWTTAEKLFEPISTDKYECVSSFAKSGSIYFTSSKRSDCIGNQCDIYCSKADNNQFLPAQHLTNLNTDRSECMISVSPDEKYIVFTRFLFKNGKNATDFHISFRKKDGNWSLAQKLGTSINSTGSNHTPTFSSDGKYFFFSQYIKTDSGTNEKNRYWVSTAMFDQLRESSLSSIKNK